MPCMSAPAGAAAGPTIGAGRALDFPTIGLAGSGRSMGAPFFFKDSDDASRIWTTSRPAVPDVSGVFPCLMQSRKCWHSVFSGSSCLM